MGTDIDHTEDRARRVVVVGGGYAGLMAANRLRASLTAAEQETIEVVMVNPRPDFVERIRLHELAAGSRPTVLRPLEDLLHPDVDLVVGTVERIDTVDRSVVVTGVDGDRDLGFDLVVYAVGSVAGASIPGARHYAFLLADLDGADRAREAVAAAAPGARIVVVGGGATGVEAAAELAEARPDLSVRLLSGGPVLGEMRPAARRSVTRRLRRLGVTVVEGARVERVEAGALVLADGQVERFAACLVAASFAVPDLAARSGLAVDERGRLQVDAALRSLSHPTVIGAGDAIVLPSEDGAHLRMGCATALPLGGRAAEATLAVLRGEAPRPASVGFVVQCLSLGRRHGYIQPVRADDSPRRLHVGGRLGALAKEAVCRYVVTGPQRERDRPGAYRVPRGPRR